MSLGLDALILVVVTAVAASIGSPATPGVGIVVLATALLSVGIPAPGIALLVGVDRVLDLSRTVVNVTADLTASTVLTRLLAGGGSARQERRDEASRDALRRATGDDGVVTGP